MKKRQQLSTDNLDGYWRERKAFDGSAEIQSRAVTDAYREGFDKIDWTKRKEKRP